MVGTPTVGSLAAGDPAHVEAAYRAHSGKCHALAVQIVRDTQLAQDVVQEVFVAFHRQPERFDPDKGSLATWLLTITHHKSVDLVRTAQRRAGLDTAMEFAADLADVADSPEAQASRNEEQTQVRAAMTTLTGVEREVIVLAYFGGFTQSQIAARTAIPLGTVKSRTLSGLRRMRDILAPEAGPQFPAVA